MPWIGILCEVDDWKLAKWAEEVRKSGGAEVAEFLTRAAKVMSGEKAGISGVDRMLEIESRAAKSLDMIHARASEKAAAVMSRAMVDGVSIPAMMSAAGMDGWRAGSATEKNGGVLRRKRRYQHGQAVAGKDGQPVALAEPGEPPLTVASTVARDRRYGESWEGWAGVELVKAGFKMRHVAKGVCLEVSEAWRHVSGFTKHWRREGLAGRQFPGPKEGWILRLEAATQIALNTGVKGARVKLNGTGDLGVAVDPDPEAEGES